MSNYSCPLCPREWFSSQKALKLHLSSHTLPGDQPLDDSHPNRRSNRTRILPRPNSFGTNNSSHHTSTNNNPSANQLHPEVLINNQPSEHLASTSEPLISLTATDQHHQHPPDEVSRICSPFSFPDDSTAGALHPHQFPLNSYSLNQTVNFHPSMVHPTLSTLTPHQVLQARLYATADAAGAPKYLVDELLRLISDSTAQYGFTIDNTSYMFPSRRTYFGQLQEISGIPPPEAIPVELESGYTCIVYRHHFLQLFQDHLLSDAFSSIEDLDLPNPQIPFSSEPSGPFAFSSLTSSIWYHSAYHQRSEQLSPSRAILHPLVLYIDKTGVDGIMKSTVEPLVCTSAILSQEQRQDPKNWIVLGYIPNMDNLKSRPGHLHSQWSPPCSTTIRDYHRCLAVLLQPIKALQHKAPILKIRRGDSVRPMHVHCPIVSVLGDNLSQNQLCGRVGNSTESSVRMSRCCLTTASCSDEIPHECNRFPTGLLRRLTSGSLGMQYGNDHPIYLSDNLHAWKQYLSNIPSRAPFSRKALKDFKSLREKVCTAILQKCLGSHVVINAFEGIDFGPNSCIHTATVSDIMHSLESGLIQKLLSVLLDLMPNSQTAVLDEMVEVCFGNNKSGASELFPRISFLRGFSSLTLLSSSERVGQLFVIALLLNTPTGRRAFEKRFAVEFDSNRLKRKGQLKREADQEESEESVETESDNDSSTETPLRSTYTKDEINTILQRLDLTYLVEAANYLPAAHKELMYTVLQTTIATTQKNNLLLESTTAESVFPSNISLDYSNKSIFQGVREKSENQLHPEWPEELIDLTIPPARPRRKLQLSTDRVDADCSISLDMDQFRQLVELILCFHSFLKYGGSLFQEEELLHDRIESYQKSFHSMMEMLKDGIMRGDNSMQFRLQKFVECCHFLQDHLLRGPNVAHSTDTGERGLKRWAKAPARTAQNRSDNVFKQQVARNMHQAYLLRCVHDKHPTPVARDPGTGVTEVSGGNFVFIFRANVAGFFPSTCITKATLPLPLTNFPPAVVDFFKTSIGPWYSERLGEHPDYQLVIRTYTELKLPSSGCTVRCHPMYRKENEWYDYTTVAYAMEDGEQKDYPCRCTCIFTLPDDLPRDLLHCIVPVNDNNATAGNNATAEIFVLVQEVQNQSNHQLRLQSKICSRWTLQHVQCGRTHLHQPKLKCVTHHCLGDPILIIPYNLDNGKGSSLPSLCKQDGSDYEILWVADRREKWPLAFLD